MAHNGRRRPRVRGSRRAAAVGGVAGAAALAAVASGVPLIALGTVTDVHACDTACPSVRSAIPERVDVAAAPAEVHVYGDALADTSQVYLEPDDTTVTFSVVSSSELTVALPPATSDGSHWFVVVTPEGTTDAHPPFEITVAHPQVVPASSGAPTPAVSLEPAPTVEASPAPTVEPAAAVATASGSSVTPWLMGIGGLGAAALAASVSLVFQVSGRLRAARERRALERATAPAVALPAEPLPDDVVDDRLSRL